MLNIKGSSITKGGVPLQHCHWVKGTESDQAPPAPALRISEQTFHIIHISQWIAINTILKCIWILVLFLFEFMFTVVAEEKVHFLCV